MTSQNATNLVNIFSDLSFDKFKELALDQTKSRHEKVGFPDDYREGKEDLIFADISSKLCNLQGVNKTVLEIGPGCSHLPIMLADHCQENNHLLFFVDSQEMLDLLPDFPGVKKVSGFYPRVPEIFSNYLGRVDVILAYSVVQYVFTEANLWEFLDASLALLSEGGEILLGDIPNISMRKRFFASSAGVKSHHAYLGREEDPVIDFNRLEPGQMDDSVVMSILSRARAQGFHAWVLPQASGLPMANRREDILIRRP